MQAVDDKMAEAAVALQQMNADEISPRQIQGVDDTALRQAEVEQLKRKLADFDFPNKLFAVVDSPLLDHCIRWNADGTSLLIVNHAVFCKDALTLLSRGTFDCLTRQLQAYGFKKNSRSQCKHEYSHEKGYFLRATKKDLKRIRRKKTKGKDLAEGTESTDRVEEYQTTVLEMVTCIYDKCRLLLELVNSRPHAN